MTGLLADGGATTVGTDSEDGCFALDSFVGGSTFVESMVGFRLGVFLASTGLGGSSAAAVAAASFLDVDFSLVECFSSFAGVFGPVVADTEAGIGGTGGASDVSRADDVSKLDVSSCGVKSGTMSSSSSRLRSS